MLYLVPSFHVAYHLQFYDYVYILPASRFTQSPCSLESPHSSCFQIPTTTPIRLHLHGTREMAYQINGLVAKTDNLGLIAGTYRIREN
ncbi:hypothetical protein H671_1g2385 [Cricetulus griseus]|nr:hypothetical protein H671_1g2385 [Cricetulus griseus]